MSTDAPEPFVGIERPTLPLLRLLGSIAAERDRGGDFTACSRETLEAPGVREALARLGYPVTRHNRETYLVDFPRAARPDTHQDATP